MGTIGGGENNTITGTEGCVPGGLSNGAGANAFAAGTQAKANHQGSFVWADSTAGVYGNFASAANNEVAFRCNGGVRFTSGAGGANQTVAWTPGSAAWTWSSDRNLKEGLATVDGKAVLDKLSHLPLSEWNYKG